MSKHHSTHSLAIWPTLPLDVHFRTPSQWRPFPLDREDCRIYSLARHAIWNACRAVGLGEDDIILVPAYHHGSEIEALLQAGLQILYYEVTDDLEPDPVQLQSILNSHVRALYLIHYLGFPQRAAFWRQWCDDHHLLLIEDAAQAFLATIDQQPLGSFGHMGVFCLYKTYGLPDGGAVISFQPPPPPATKTKNGLWKVFKRHVNFIAARNNLIGLMHLKLKPRVTQWNRKWNVIRGKLHKEFELGDPERPPSAMTTRLLPLLVNEKTAARRRENYRFLLRHLGDLVPAPFASLPEGACPFAFPIKVAETRTFLNQIRSKGIMGLLFWLNPHPSLPVEDFQKSRALRERVVALPVHQELTLFDLQQIVDVVQEVYNQQPSVVNLPEMVFSQPK